jgi:hypothetical protein
MEGNKTRERNAVIDFWTLPMSDSWFIKFFYLKQRFGD